MSTEEFNLKSVEIEYEPFNDMFMVDIKMGDEHNTTLHYAINPNTFADIRLKVGRAFVARLRQGPGDSNDRS